MQKKNLEKCRFFCFRFNTSFTLKFVEIKQFFFAAHTSSSAPHICGTPIHVWAIYQQIETSLVLSKEIVQSEEEKKLTLKGTQKKNKLFQLLVKEVFSTIFYYKILLSVAASKKYMNKRVKGTPILKKKNSFFLFLLLLLVSSR